MLHLLSPLLSPHRLDHFIEDEDVIIGLGVSEGMDGMASGKGILVDVGDLVGPDPVVVVNY